MAKKPPPAAAGPLGMLGSLASLGAGLDAGAPSSAMGSATGGTAQTTTGDVVFGNKGWNPWMVLVGGAVVVGVAYWLGTRKKS